ncbi:hypothetical protein [uncultured Tateyamaria sp.]|uniref:hypothetical protein n=1 Tax=uncultured Tateyamaria sp. TaxID=455651 RepID=UPI00262587B2|nr:hypothetical protein [uncultured Tateyamaria sp.]
MQDDIFARRARTFEWATIGLITLLCVAAAISIADGGLGVAALREDYATTHFPDTPGPWAIGLWRMVEVASFGLLLWVLWCIRSWLAACADGDIFESDTARQVLRIGQGLLALAVINVFSHTLVILALTWNNAPGQRTLSVAIDGTGLFLLLAAAVLTLFGYIQSEAARLMTENKEFV